MQVQCPQCSEMLRAEDMNLETMVGRCRRCHALVNLWDFIPGDARPTPRGSQERIRPRAARPLWMVVENEGTQLRISWRWFSWPIWFLVFFCIAWDSFLVFWYCMGINQPGMPWIFYVFPIGHVAVGVGLTYFTLACLINRTELVADHDQVRIGHGPLPWRGNVSLPAQEIAQVYVAPAYAGIVWWLHMGGFQRSGFGATLKVLLRDGSSRTLVTLTDSEAAFFLEQEIEKFLGISDEPVAGELPH